LHTYEGHKTKLPRRHYFLNATHLTAFQPGFYARARRGILQAGQPCSDEIKNQYVRELAKPRRQRLLALGTVLDEFAESGDRSRPPDP